MFRKQERKEFKEADCSYPNLTQHYTVSSYITSFHNVDHIRLRVLCSFQDHLTVR
jgi:hypothetical protein